MRRMDELLVVWATTQTKFIMNLTWLNLLVLSLFMCALDLGWHSLKEKPDNNDIIFSFIFWPILFTFYRQLFRWVFPLWIKEQQKEKEKTK